MISHMKITSPTGGETRCWYHLVDALDLEAGLDVLPPEEVHRVTLPGPCGGDPKRNKTR